MSGLISFYRPIKLGHLLEAGHNGSSVDPDRGVRLALYASRAVVVHLAATEGFAEQR